MFATNATRTHTIRERLRDDRVWIDQDGREHEIATMDRRHAANVVRYLERRAARLHDGEVDESFFWPEPRGEQASWDLDDERMRLMDADPLDWLRDQPLVRALRARAGNTAPGPSRRWLLRHPVIAARRALRA